MNIDAKFLFKEKLEKLRFYDVLGDCFTKKCGDVEDDQNDDKTADKYWNLIIENRQERVEYFNKCVGKVPKAGPNEGGNQQLKTKPLIHTRPSSFYGYKRPLKYQWPAYVAGECINGAVGIDFKGQSESLTFCISVTYEATQRVRSRSLQEDESEATEILFSKTYSSESIDIKCEDLLFSAEKDVENINSAYENVTLIFPYNIAISPNSYPSIQSLGGAVILSQIHALYARIRIYSQEGVLKAIKYISTGIWVEPKLNRSPVLSLTSKPLTIKQDYSAGLFGTSGKISCEVTLEQNFFNIGDIIQITLKVRNESSGDIGRLEGNLSLEGQGQGHNFTFTTKPVYGPGVAANSVKEIQLLVPMTFTSAGLSDCLLPVSCGNYKCMEFTYNVKVYIVRAGFRKNIVIEIPVYLTSNTHFF